MITVQYTGYSQKHVELARKKGHSRVLRSVSLMFVSIAVFQRLHSFRGFSLILMRM